MIGNVYEQYKNKIPTGTTFGAMGSLIGSSWRGLSKEERAPYDAQSLADKIRYNNELQAFRVAHGNYCSACSAALLIGQYDWNRS
jgi:hypothetical protein